MSRKQAIEAMKSAGATDDNKAWLRLYTENRISYPVAKQAWNDGQAFARFVQRRDAATK